MTISINSGSFAPFGEITTGPAPRVEKSQEERDREMLADRIGKEALLVAMRWDATQLDFAISAYHFPKSAGRTSRARHFLVGASAMDSEPYWLKSKIAEWKTEIREFVSTLR